MHQILIIDQNVVAARHLETILNKSGHDVIGIATSYQKAKLFLLGIKPDLIICDVDVEGNYDGIDLMQEVEIQYRIPYIFIAETFDQYVLNKAKSMNPSNFIIKPFNEKQLLVSVHQALKPLSDNQELIPTERELTILKFIAKGKSSREIAQNLTISFNTVESHRKNLLRKYKLNTMTEMICLATSRGWIAYDMQFSSN